MVSGTCVSPPPAVMPERLIGLAGGVLEDRDRVGDRWSVGAWLTGVTVIVRNVRPEVVLGRAVVGGERHRAGRRRREPRGVEVRDRLQRLEKVAGGVGAGAGSGSGARRRG